MGSKCGRRAAPQPGLNELREETAKRERKKAKKERKKAKMNVRQPELQIDPPAEPENDSELTELLDKAHFYRRELQSIGIKLAEAKLLTRDEDAEWEYAFGCFELLLEAAAGRVAVESRRRREAAADDG